MLALTNHSLHSAFRTLPSRMQSSYIAMSVSRSEASRCCRLCCTLLGPMTYRLFNRIGSVSPLCTLLCQYNETSLPYMCPQPDIEKKKNLLCQHCHTELNALSKRELELMRNKELRRKRGRQIFTSLEWKDAEEARILIHYWVHPWGRALHHRESVLQLPLIAQQGLHLLECSLSLLHQQRMQPVFQGRKEASWLPNFPPSCLSVERNVAFKCHPMTWTWRLDNPLII